MWQTSGRLDAGTYTIFAVGRLVNRYSLRDVSYSTYMVTCVFRGRKYDQ